MDVLQTGREMLNRSIIKCEHDRVNHEDESGGENAGR